MRAWKRGAIGALLALASASCMGAEERDKLFVTVTSGEAQAQGFSMILAKQGLKQGQEPRVLLCGPGAEMATEGYEAETLQPAGANPQELMQGLIEQGVQVDVCAIFLPNTTYTEADLIEGVGVASAGEVGAYMADPGVRYFSH